MARRRDDLVGRLAAPLPLVAWVLVHAVALLLTRVTASDAHAVALVSPAAGVAAVWFAVHRGRRGRVPRTDAVLLPVSTAITLTLNGMPLWEATGLALGGLLGAWTFARTLHTWAPQLWAAGGDRALARPREVFPLVAACLASSAATAVVFVPVFAAATAGWSLDTALLLLARNTTSTLLIVAAALLVGPPLLASFGVLVARADDRRLVWPRGWRRVELVVALASSAAAVDAVFGTARVPMAFAVMALSVWVALRFPTPVGVAHDVLLGVAVTVLTVRGFGAFSVIVDTTERALVAQAFVGLVCVVGLILATGRDERVTLLGEQRRAAQEAQATTRRVQALAAATTAVATADDPRAAVSEAARELTGSHSAFLLEPDGTGLLTSTGAAGWDLPVSLPVTSGSMAGVVFRSGEAAFVPDITADARVSPVLQQEMGRVAAMWLPVPARDGRVAGVLVVIWRWRRTALPVQETAMLEALVAEAAHAVERADLLVRLETAAEHDPLTGLANRRAWDAAVATEVAVARRDGRPLTIAIVDLDHFKAYNDTHGHRAGDRLLVDFARLLPACLREGDTVARWGGEEFAVALPGCTAEEAAALARRIQAVVPQGQTCTVGVAAWELGLSADDVLERADAALYRGKAGGRDLVVLHGRAVPGVLPRPFGAPSTDPARG